jgi:hypothetical protein
MAFRCETRTAWRSIGVKVRLAIVCKELLMGNRNVVDFEVGGGGQLQ